MTGGNVRIEREDYWVFRVNVDKVQACTVDMEWDLELFLVEIYILILVNI